MNMPKIRVPIAPVGSRHRSAKDYDRRQNASIIHEELSDFFCPTRLRNLGWISHSSWNEEDGLLEWYENEATEECLSADELKERLS